MKTVDILIPTYKPGKQFLELIALLQKQTVPIQKIIIMNTEQSYWEQFVCEGPALLSYDNLEVHHLTQSEFDHGATRHRGMQHSSADICVCMTQDAIPYDEYVLAHLIEPLMEEQIAVSYARQLPRVGAGALEQFTRNFNYPEGARRKSFADLETMGIKAFFCSDVCAAYQRHIYEKLGGFVSPTIFNEDMIFAARALRAGYDVYYAAEAKVLHSHEYSFFQQLRRNFDLAASQAMYSDVFAGISSEKEGKKMVLSACKHFITIKKPFQIVHLVLQSGAKYIGYFLGKRYKKLPMSVIKYLTASPSYWEKNGK